MKPIQFKKQWLLLIFVLALIVSVALGTVLPVSTQTPPAPSPCEQLKVNIQTRAKQDANDDRFNFFTSTTKKKKITDISKLYDKKTLSTNVLNNMNYGIFTKKNMIPINILPGCLSLLFSS